MQMPLPMSEGERLLRMQAGQPLQAQQLTQPRQGFPWGMFLGGVGMGASPLLSGGIALLLQKILNRDGGK